ncbi:MAG: Gfo/Idh/MocA family oxidoreductase [Bryobacteraceae bacterium]|nr:Gfo/Idh/MocA family oxidoreductase [Bryobacteraceae bacterium]
MRDSSPSRRVFLGAVTAASYQRILGANDRVQIGVIGYGLIGAFHAQTFKNQRDVDVVGVADVYQPRVEAGVAACGPQAKGYRDFRKMLDVKDIDGVVAALPDHWHALATILACAAGKDVYVEKPMTLFVREGEWMVKAARKYRRVVQVGTQQRSGLHFQEAKKLLQQGYIGKIVNCRIASFRNVMPGFGAPPDSAPPSELDYEMWLGPAPKRPYNPQRSLYNFRWFWDYSGGQMTNLGAHNLDIVHWITGVKGPTKVASVGGRLALTEDNGETPDTQEAIFEYPGFTVSVAIREAAAGFRAPFELCGTKGSISISRGGFEIRPDMKVYAANQIPDWSRPPGHPPRSDVKPTPWIEGLKREGSSDEQMDLHVRNFVDCIKSRQRPVADVEDGHQVSTACHLANISLQLGRSVKWDPEKEEIVGDREASAKLERPYRKPWDEALRSLKL